MALPRARDLGIRIGAGVPGSANAITDVAGVRVGHRTVIRGDDGAPDAVRTGRHGDLPDDRTTLGRTGLRRNAYPQRLRRADRDQLDPGVGHPREPDRADELAADRQGLRRHRALDRARKDPVAGEEVMPCVTECDDSWLSAVLDHPLVGRGRVGRARRARPPGPVEEGCVGLRASACSVSTSRAGSARPLACISETRAATRSACS